MQAGVTSLWEVTLYPARGTAGPPLWVVVPGRNSIDATNQALAQNPGLRCRAGAQSEPVLIRITVVLALAKRR